MTDDDVRACIRIGCSMKGVRTTDAQCPECGMPTMSGGTAAPSITQRESPDRYVAAGDPDYRPTLLMVTSDEIAGYRIVRVHGVVFGTVVRARNFFSNQAARFQTVVGGEVEDYTALVIDSRNVARQRLQAAASKLGANAIVAMRFDCNEMGDIMSEVTAYGTAVTVTAAET